MEDANVDGWITLKEIIRKTGMDVADWFYLAQAK